MLLKDASNNPGPKGSVKQRVGDMFASGMDSLAIEKLGYDPIKPDLERIAKINSLTDVVNEFTYEHAHAISTPLLGFG